MQEIQLVIKIPEEIRLALINNIQLSPDQQSICDSINNDVNEIIRQQMEALPEGANIICSPYVENPTMIYAVKNFDVKDLLFDSQERSDNK